MVDDDLDWRSDRVQAALKSFGTMLGYTDPQASRLTWDQATKKLASGGCAFESMNDSAFGELVAAGANEGEDFGSTRVPRHRRELPRRRRRLRRRDEGEERQERARVPRRHQRARHAARVQRGEGVGPGPPRRRRLVADRLPASVLEGPVDDAGAAVDRPRRGDEPGVPGGLLRRGARPTSGPGTPTRSPTTSKTRSPRTSSRRADPGGQRRHERARRLEGPTHWIGRAREVSPTAAVTPGVRSNRPPDPRHDPVPGSAGPPPPVALGATVGRRERRDRQRGAGTLDHGCRRPRGRHQRRRRTRFAVRDHCRQRRRPGSDRCPRTTPSSIAIEGAGRRRVGVRRRASVHARATTRSTACSIPPSRSTPATPSSSTSTA